MSNDRTNYEKMNASAKGWARETRQKLKSAIVNAGAVKTGNLQRSVRFATRQSFGVLTSLSFKFPRYGVFVEKGVGKGWPISGRTAQNSVKARIAKPWFNPTIDNNIDKLADDLSKHSADIVTDNIKIR